jgi:RNA polymerase sigma factor (sigma-70 family)
MRHHNDQRYIDALINNDRQLLGELYKKFSGKIKQMVMHNNGSETDAGDIFQDALLSIYRKASSGNFILTCPFEAFLITICKRQWLKELVKRKQQWVTNDRDEVYNAGEDSFTLAAEIERDEARNSLFIQKLAELDEACRQLLQMSWGGKPMADVAQSLNMSYGYFRKKKSLCMEKLIVLVKRSAAYNALK